MRTKIHKLTDAERARMASWADEWIARGLCTDRADWDDFERGARECYRMAGLAPPRVIVRCSSPLVAMLAGGIADQIIKRGGAAGDAVTGAVSGAVAAAVSGPVGDAVSGHVRGAVGGVVGDAVGGAVDDAISGHVRDAVGDAVSGPVRDAGAGVVAGVVGDAVHHAVDGPVRGAVSGAVYGAVDGPVNGAVHDAVGDAVYGPVHGVVYGAVHGPVNGAVHDAVHDAVYGAVHGPVDGPVRGAVGGAVGDAVGGALRGAVGDAVDGAVSGPVRGAVSGPVRDAVDSEVYDAVRGVKAQWSPYIGGQLWSSWLAWESFFHEVCQLDSGKRAEAEAYRLAQTSACWWIPYRWGIMVSDRPTEIHREQVGERGWGSHQLHRDDGPAVAWPDGWGVYSIHGVRVPARVVEAPETMTVQEIKAEPNAEVRRVMRERFGESRYQLETGAKLLHADYEGARKGAAPRAFTVDDTGQRWLIGTDGSTGRTYHMPVPAHVTTCREAHEALCGFDETAILNKS